jgi:hypothetical protein
MGTSIVSIISLGKGVEVGVRVSVGVWLGARVAVWLGVSMSIGEGVPRGVICTGTQATSRSNVEKAIIFFMVILQIEQTDMEINLIPLFGGDHVNILTFK